MARTYKRDSRGRFAGGGGGSRSTSSKPAGVGRSGPRGGKVGTRAEQRRAAKAQQQRSQAFRSKATGAGRSARDAYKASAGAARAAARGGARNGIRSTGRLPRPVAANGIRRTTGPRRGPLAVKMNAVRAYKPATARGKAEQGLRQMRRAESDLGKVIGNLRNELQKGKPKRQALLRKADQWQIKMERQTARDLANRSNPGVTGRIARIKLSVTPGNLQRAGADVIRRRAARATAAAARGSKPAARAREIYGQQLAFTGSGKPSKARNNLKPGPRNTKGTPRRRRSRRPKG